MTEVISLIYDSKLMTQRLHNESILRFREMKKNENKGSIMHINFPRRRKIL